MNNNNSIQISRDKLLLRGMASEKMNQKKSNIQTLNETYDKQVKIEQLKKLRKYYNDFKSLKNKLGQLQQKTRQSILPERERLMEDIFSKQKKKQSILNRINAQKQLISAGSQLTKRLRQQSQREQELLIEALQRKEHLTLRLQETQLTASDLIEQKLRLSEQNGKEEHHLIEKQKLIGLEQQQLQHVSYYELQSLKEYFENAKIHSTDQRGCLLTRIQVKAELQENVQKRRAELALVYQQNEELQKHIHLIHSKQLQVNYKKQTALQQEEQEKSDLTNTIMQNTELKARLQILQHTLNDHINHSNQLHEEIYRKGTFQQQSQYADRQAQQYFQQLVMVKLQAEYLESRSRDVKLQAIR